MVSMNSTRRNVKYLSFTLLYALWFCALLSCTAPSDSEVEVSLVFSGEEAGFIEPCGCALSQLGGLARRATAIAQLRSRGQPQALEALRSERATPVLLFHGTLEEASLLAQQVPEYKEQREHQSHVPL